MRVTADDRRRTERVQAEAGRQAAATAMSHAEFLDSLRLTVHVVEAGPAELGRVTQLINKTNQFNLTTRRRSEPEVGALLADDAAQVLAFGVEDRFGAYGIVGVTIACWDGGRWDLDTVLMSCRVLGRGVETAMLAATVEQARANRSGPVHGRYVASGRNAMVAGLFAAHGFTLLDGNSWRLDADASIVVPAHIALAS